MLASSSLDRKDKGPSSSAGASMAALAAAAVAGEDALDSCAAEGALPPHGEEDEKPAKLAALGGASSSSPVAARRGAAGGASSSSMLAAKRGAAAAAIAAGGGGGGGGPSCQADRCNADMSKEDKRYNRRHKVCELHHKAPVVLVAGLRQRFCQQCSRFHELSEFDDTKRSCRQRLAGHNERRRKSSADANANGDSSRHADQDGRGAPGNHFQIR